MSSTLKIRVQDLKLGGMGVVQLVQRLRLHLVQLPQDGAQVAQLDGVQLRCSDLHR